jgi:hypothetical protein
MWFHHFVNFTRTCLGVFLAVLGTSAVGFVTVLLDSLTSIGVTLYRVLRKQGVAALRQQWRETAKIALQTAFWVTLIIYGPIFAYSIASAVYDDHQWQMARWQKSENGKVVLAKQLEQEKDKSRPKFEIVTAGQAIGDAVLTESGKSAYFTDAYLQVAVLNHGAPSVIKEWKEFITLKDGTELEGRLLMGTEKSIHSSVNGPRGRVELPIYPSLISVWSITPIPTGGRGVGSVIFLFPQGTKAKFEAQGGIVTLKLWDVSGKEYDSVVPWKAPQPNQEVYMLPGMGPK